MPVVMKFGGSSLATAERVANAARLVAEEAAKGIGVLVVVSAQGDTTDDLIEKACGISANASAREMDSLLATGEQAAAALMAMALEAMGLAAVSLSGWQAGIETCSSHGEARIINIDVSRIERELARGRIVVVAGFQGIGPNGDITTIGRGGSDTTAVALAAELNAEECLIYTDVDGVFSADPLTIEGTVRHGSVSYDEMNALASMGAQVLHGRSVSLAKSRRVPVRVLSSLERGQGTRLALEQTGSGAVTAVTCEEDVVFVELTKIGRGDSLAVLSELVRRGVVVDMMCIRADSVSFAAPRAKLNMAREVLDKADGRDAPWGTRILEKAVKVSAVGTAISENPLVLAQMLDCLARAGIEPLAFCTGDLRASALLGGDCRARAVQLLHDLFFPQASR